MTPALDRKNLERLAGALDEVAAHQDPDGPYGRWQVGDDSERRWVQFEPTGVDREARASWRPDPANPDSFDRAGLAGRCFAHSVPTVPRDAQDHERDDEADDRVGNRHP